MSNDKPLIIFASSRNPGDTKEFVDKIFSGLNHKLVDLTELFIAPYNYSNIYPGNDHFLGVIDEMLNHKVIVFATPVYWYAMSGQMKIFFDRFTDLVTVKKHMGKQMTGKSTFLIAVGADKDLPEGFETPFKLTSDYLNMIYRDCIYNSIKFPRQEEELHEKIEQFKNNISRLIGLP